MDENEATREEPTGVIPEIRREIKQIREELKESSKNQRSFASSLFRRTVNSRIDLAEKIDDRLNKIEEDMQKGDEKAANKAFEQMRLWLKAKGVV